MWIIKHRITVIYLIIAAFLFLLPFVYDSRNLFILLTQIFIFSIFAMSYDLLLGFTGIVSFGHAMFFGIGAYSMGIFMKKMEPTMLSFVLAVLATIVLTSIASFIVGLLTLRLKSHFYAMLTLSLAGLMAVAAEKWRTLTFGNDGFTFMIPEQFIDRSYFYLLCLIVMAAVFLFLKLFTNSPLGKILQAIRENEQRVESLGFKVLHYKVAASMVAGILAGCAGILYAISLRFVNTSVFSMDVTLDALLMTIIGGTGTLVGAIIGSGLIEFAHNWLTELAKQNWIFERWIIFFGIVYILTVIFFPQGIVGTLKSIKWKRKKHQALKKKENLAG
jgi:branched-chain amino acid transport system permease protein